MERIIYKSQCKRLFNLSGGLCYLKMRGSIYFLATTKYESINLLRKTMNYETKMPTEFYNIIHDNFLKQCNTTQRIENSKQPYYRKRKIKKNKDKIKRLKSEIKELEQNNDM